MHPAYSVILFTTASGAGYGLLIWLAVAAIAGRPDAGMNFGVFTAMVIAATLVTVGLLSSTAHLGRPERAWRAFSQWRTSWLSREGVMAIATYAVGGLFALMWLRGEAGSGPVIKLLAAGTIVAAVVTLWCTGMIYASLKTIRAWNHHLVAPLYVLLGLATGRVLLNAINAVTSGGVTQRAIWLTLSVLLAGWIAKTLYWSAIDDARRSYTVGSATGLGRFGAVRPLEPPHTQPNFIMREMGYQVARKHAAKLRQVATLLLFVVPLAVTLAMLVAPTFAAVLAVVAMLSAVAGVLVERWLFFAEAEHVSMLYYGREAA